MIEHASETLAPVSIVLNIWNGDNHVSLRRSLESILRQNYQPNEVVIVLDGPINDNLKEVISHFLGQKQTLFRVIETTMTTGLWNARNIGIEAAKNEFIALHDADDVMHPSRLHLQAAKIEAIMADVIIGPVIEFDAESERVIGVRRLCDNSSFERKMLLQNTINHSSVMLRKSKVLEVGGYRNIYLAEDYDLWLRMLKCNKKFYCDSQILQGFSVDKKLSSRRGGLKFFKSEFQISRSVSNLGKLSMLKLFFVFVLRIVYRTSPRIVRRFHREYFQIEKVQSHKTLSDFLGSDLLTS